MITTLCTGFTTEITPLKDVRENLTKSVHFKLSTPGLEKDQIHKLNDIINRYKGNCDTVVHVVILNRSETIISLPDEVKISPSDEMLRDVEKLFGYNIVSFQ